MSTPFRRITAAVTIAGAAICVAPVVAGASPAAPAACPLIALGGGVLKVDTNCLTSGLGLPTSPTTVALPTPTIPVVQTPTTLHLGDDDPDWTIHVESDETTATTLPAAARKATDDTTGTADDTGSTAAAVATGAAGTAGATGGSGGVPTPVAARSGAERSATGASDLAGATPAADASPVAAVEPAAAKSALDASPTSTDDGGSPWVTWSLVAVAFGLSGGLVWRNHLSRTRSDVDSPARWYDRVTFS